jgi:MFS family permease
MLFVIAAVFYIVCVFLILRIPKSAFDQPRTHVHTYKHEKDGAYAAAVQSLQTLWKDMVGGWRIVRADRLLYFSVIQLSLIGVLMQLIGELAGTFVKQILNRPVEDMSLVLVPAAVGLVGASVLMTQIVEKIGRIRLTVIGFFALAIGFILLPSFKWLGTLINPKNGIESPIILVSVILVLFILGVAMACVNIPTQTIMQERSPESGRARVISLQTMIYSAGTIPVLLFAGAFTVFIGFTQLIILIAVSLLAFCGWGIWYTKKTNLQDLNVK